MPRQLTYNIKSPGTNIRARQTISAYFANVFTNCLSIRGVLLGAHQEY